MTPPMEDRTAPNTSGYRRDLDGLRGIAIAFVVIFHVFVNRVSGGVDVFLLLSGFFFLGSQLRNAERPGQSINPWWSIWRTMRRLLPSLLLVVGTALLVYAVLPAFRSFELISQFPASVLYYQNWMLIDLEQDYNAASADVSPLQHLWSMSVQGQFYLSAILLICFIAFLSRTFAAEPSQSKVLRTTMLTILSVVTVASFIYAIFLHQSDQALNYYSTFSRLWELTLGGLLALLITRIRLPQWLPRGPIAMVGLLMMLSTGFLIDGAKYFPGPATLWPLIGAALVVLAGGGADVSTRILSSKPMVWLGDIAYALYLWHWPILIVAIFVLNRSEVGLRLGTAVIVLSVILAWITHRFLERPLMQKGRRPARGSKPAASAMHTLRSSRAAQARAVVALGLAVVMVLCISAPERRESALAVARSAEADPERYPGALSVTENLPVPDGVRPLPSPEFANSLYPDATYDGCIALATREPSDLELTKHLKDPDDDDPEMCFYGDEDAEQTIVLVGGSHTEHWFTPIEAIAGEQGYRVLVILRQGCAATLSDVAGRSTDCTEFGRTAADYILDLDPEMIITSGTRPGSERTDYTPDGYVEFWDLMLENGIAVGTIRDNPWPYDQDGELFNPVSCYSRTGDLAACGMDRDWVMSPDDDAANYLAGNPNAVTMDFTDAMCPDGFCPPVIGNLYVYRDNNHLTELFARTLTNEMRVQLAPFLEELSARRAG